MLCWLVSNSDFFARNAYCCGMLCWMAGDGASFGCSGKVEARGAWDGEQIAKCELLRKDVVLLDGCRHLCKGGTVLSWAQVWLSSSRFTVDGQRFGGESGADVTADFGNCVPPVQSATSKYSREWSWYFHDVLEAKVNFQSSKSSVGDLAEPIFTVTNICKLKRGTESQQTANPKSHDLTTIIRLNDKVRAKARM
jgi:hypothetical protein